MPVMVPNMIPNDDVDYATDPDPEYVTNGLYSTEDEDGTSYYFRGAVDDEQCSVWSICK